MLYAIKTFAGIPTKKDRLEKVARIAKIMGIPPVGISSSGTGYINPSGLGLYGKLEKKSADFSVDTNLE